MKGDRKRATRERIVDTAAEAFRGGGIAATGVAELMGRAGLTHGGFYAHFPSKGELVAEACAAATAQTRARLQKLAANAGPDQAYAALVGAYLSAEHRDRPERGCTLATLGPEVARERGPARAVMSRHVQLQAELFAAALPPDLDDRRGRGLATLARLVGALVIARCVDDPGLSAEVLEACHRRLLDENGNRPSHAADKPQRGC